MKAKSTTYNGAPTYGKYNSSQTLTQEFFEGGEVATAPGGLPLDSFDTLLKGALKGSGLEYLASTKSNQMRYAAESWVDESKYTGQYQLAAIEVAGPEFAIEHFIDDIA